jgi:hypothetical protein
MNPEQLERELEWFQEFRDYLLTLDHRAYVQYWGQAGATRAEIERKIIRLEYELEHRRTITTPKSEPVLQTNAPTKDESKRHRRPRLPYS